MDIEKEIQQIRDEIDILEDMSSESEAKDLYFRLAYLDEAVSDLFVLVRKQVKEDQHKYNSSFE